MTFISVVLPILHVIYFFQYIFCPNVPTFAAYGCVLQYHTSNISEQHFGLPWIMVIFLPIVFFYLFFTDTVRFWSVHWHFPSLKVWLQSSTRMPSLQWQNERHVVSNHQHFHRLLKRFIKRASRKTSMLCVTGLCEGSGGLPSRRPSILPRYAN